MSNTTATPLVKLTIEVSNDLYEQLHRDARSVRILSVEECATAMIENAYRFEQQLRELEAKLREVEAQAGATATVASKLGMAEVIRRRWADNNHREGWQKVSYEYVHNEILDLLDIIDALTAQAGATVAGEAWEVVSNGAVVGHNLTVESEPDGGWRLWIGGASVVFPPTVRLQRRTTAISAAQGQAGEVTPTIVCLCGSTRFWRQFQISGLEETLAGKIVLSIGSASGTDDDHFGHLSKEEHDRVIEQLNELHRRKIDMADEVLILNVGGYIGTHTLAELDYARKLGKTVRFLEPEQRD